MNALAEQLMKCDQVFIVVPESDAYLGKACASEKNIRGMELKLLTHELRNFLKVSALR